MAHLIRFDRGLILPKFAPHEHLRDSSTLLRLLPPRRLFGSAPARRAVASGHDCPLQPSIAAGPDPAWSSGARHGIVGRSRRDGRYLRRWNGPPRLDAG